MKYLLDTHVFIWWMEENRRLSAETKAIIDDPLNDIFISVVTPWEIVIKIKAKKLKVPKNYASYVLNSIFELLPIEISHVLGIEKLPDIHKDPFDRILISQARAENLTLITHDPKIWEYKVPLIKA